MAKRPVDPLDAAKQVCVRLNATLERPLGAGAHKQAFLITNQGTQYALKIAPVTSGMDGRLDREAKALLDCHHPAIARLHTVDRCEIAGEQFCVMVEEYLAGGTLGAFIAARGADVQAARRTALTMADALAHLQPRNFVHRDIKPANILFRADDQPVLTDFGIVRILGEPSLTHDFMMQGPGTPYYAAPEQLLNEKASIDWRTDQFGLAVVIAEWILGRHPFNAPGAAPREAVMAVANRMPINDAAQLELEQVGLGCLVKALSAWPVQRFRRPQDFLDALN